MLNQFDSIFVLFQHHFRSILASKLDPRGPLFEVILRTGQISEKLRMSRAGAPFGRVRPGTARERKAHCAFMLVCAQSFSFDLVSARAACLCSAHDLAIASCCCSCSCFALALALALAYVTYLTYLT